MAYPPWTAPVATSFRTDSSRHSASPAQVRGKTEPSRRPLSFPPNYKSPHALNHQQSNLQEAPVCQPCPPVMEVSREIILVGPQLLIFGSRNRKLFFLEDRGLIIPRFIETLSRGLGSLYDTPGRWCDHYQRAVSTRDRTRHPMVWSLAPKPTELQPPPRLFFASLYLFGELTNNKFLEKILETLGNALMSPFHNNETN